MSSAKSFRRAAAGLALVIGLLAAAWWSVRPTSPPPPARPNVLLITIDTLRADALGAYGHPAGVSPTIDRLARAGAVFANAHAHNVVTLPSHANILSGQLPQVHGVRDNAGFRLARSTETLATQLRRRGYRTGAFVSAFPLDSRFGLDAGFDVYEDRFTGRGSRPAFLIQERAAEKTVTLARQWIDGAGGQPWFSWVHVYEPHFPYEPPERLGARWPDDPYLGEVAAADAALAPLLEPMLAAGSNGNTIVVVTSDHGEALGDHGEASHGIFAYESVLKVPLVIYAPSLFGSQVLDVEAQHVDLLPTLLDALAVEVPPGLAGRSLMPALMGRVDRSAAPVYFEALSGSLNRGWAPLTGVIMDGRKYIDLPVPELYDLRADPRESRNLAAADPQQAASLRARLEELRSKASPDPLQQESRDARERLRSLGYVTGRAPRPPAGYTEEDDPKRLIAVDRALHAIMERYLAGDTAGALTEARALVRRRPSMALAWMQRAQLEREAGNAAAAVDAMRRASELSPGDTEALALLAAYLTETGGAREAADILAAAARQTDADPDVLATRALALARIERFDEAVATLARARERDPQNAMLLVHLGTVQLTRGQRGAARDAFAEALRIDPDAARAHSSLGVLALEEGRVNEAVERWRAAVSLDPREHDKLLSLGIALARAGRTVEARACFEFFAASAPRSRYAADLDRVHAWLRGAR